MQRIRELELCHRDMFGDLVVTTASPGGDFRFKNSEVIKPIPYTMSVKRSLSEGWDDDSFINLENEKRRASALVDELLVEIYNTLNSGTTDYNSTSGKSHRSAWVDVVDLHDKNVSDLNSIVDCLERHVTRTGSVLVRQLKRRDALRRQQEAFCNVISGQLSKRTQAKGMRFSVAPPPSGESGESGFNQWAAAMKMVAQLPGGIPPEFRKRLWLTLAERHLAARKVDWPNVERTCFSEWSQPADGELGVQIVKDLHRTGCSLFCGEGGQENQALLKRVLLAYARWNKAVGYCQGFNMLAALMLQVTDRSEGDALKLMVYLIEGVLPESYFADSLRGLSVDMAVFRELLRGRLPHLAAHLDALQSAARDGSRSYEPPLTNVFTMQWFLTLFCNCLPQPTVLRLWDLILLEGDEILLRAALAIWKALAPRVAKSRTADEFYCAMGLLTRDLLAGDLLDSNQLVRAIVEIGPLTELPTLREHYLYNIHPWGAAAVPKSVGDRQLRLNTRQAGLALDISALKKQYVKLRQRQRQARVIFSAAVARQAQPAAAPVAINHLLLGKSALGNARRIGPPKANEFYWAIGLVTRDLLAGGRLDSNQLFRTIVEIGSLTELPTLREHYLYNIHPWGAAAVPKSVGDRQLRLNTRQAGLALDISALKKQCVKLRQRQRQARVIFSAAVARQAQPTAAPVAINHLLLGKSGPPKGSIPPARQTTTPSTLHWKDTKKPQSPSSSSSSDTELCDEEDLPSSEDDQKPTSSKIKSSDNLQQPDIILMKNDNIFSEDCADPEPLCEVTQDVVSEGKLESDSDGESFDFEQFLADRVKNLGANDEDCEDSGRVSYARRNSAKALQIIQENSLILHRILQCQSRLSPSPPNVVSESIEEISRDATPLIEDKSFFVSEELDKMENVHSWINSTSKNNEISSDDIDIDIKSEGNISPEYGSRYKSILEKSKSLDERYNSLILNSTHFSSDISENKQNKFNLSDLNEEVNKIKSSYGILSKENKDSLQNETLSDNISNVKNNISNLDEIYANQSPENKELPVTSSYEDIERSIKETSEFLAKYNLGNTSKISDNNLENETDNFDWRSLLEKTEYNIEESTICANTSIEYIKIEDKDSAISVSSPNQEKTTPKEPTNLFLDLDSNFESISSKLSPTLDCTSFASKSPLKSPNQKSPDITKSPNKIFNPFPVPLGTRQSKEVPFKLGLYKK